MALSPERLRLTVAIGIFAVLAGAVYWVSRFPVARRVQPTYVPTRLPTNVEGTVVGPDGKPAHAEVSLVIESSPQPMRGGPARARRLAATKTADDGTFALGSIGSGRYILVARSVPTPTGVDDATEASLWAATVVATSPTSPKHVTLTLRRGGGVNGQVILNPVGRFTTSDALGGNALANTAVTLEPQDTDAKASLLDGAARISPGPDGRFVMPDVPPGHYRLAVSVPSPWIVDVVTSGGRDALDQALAVGPGAVVSDLEVTAIDAPNTLSGEAHDATGRPAPFALVVAFAGDAEARSAPRRMQATRTDRHGHFTLTGLPSGPYRVGLAPTGPPETWYSPEFFAEIAKTASAVRVFAGVPGVALVTSGPK
jgi:hypothetical protein